MKIVKLKKKKDFHRTWEVIDHNPLHEIFFY